ncbi:MAG: hypothetical protein IPQ07_40085 [Myxococcales bacterium]|nr:hypothetical protein [Myxococcales bacterium]
MSAQDVFEEIARLEAEPKEAHSEAGRRGGTLRVLNWAVGVAMAVSDERIAALSGPQREIVREALARLAARFSSSAGDADERLGEVSP